MNRCRNRRLARWLLAAATALAVVLGRGAPASASVCGPGFTIRWVAGGTNSSWENPDNWEDASTGEHRVPAATDRVCVEVVGSNFTLVTITGAAKVRTIEAFLRVGINGSLELAPQVGDPVSVAHGALSNAGTLKGAGDLTVEGELDPGTISGAGVLTIAPSGSLKITNHVLLDDHRTLVNHAAGTWSDGDIHLKNGAVFENAGTLTVTSDNKVVVDLPSPDQPKLRNTGTVVKTGDAGVATATNVAAPFDNDGDVDVLVGRLTITGGNPSGDAATGRFGGSGGGIVELPTGSYAMGAGSVIDGRVDLTGATLAANGTVVETGAVVNVTGGVLEPNGAVVGDGGALPLAGGTIGGTGTLAVEGTLDWTSGAMTGSGTTSVAAGGVMDISPGGPKALAARTIDNQGTVSWGDTDVNAGSGARIVNGGTLTATADRTISYNLGGSQPAFLNTGTFQKTAGAGDSSLPGWIVENDGSITASSGQIVLSAGDGGGFGTSDGTSAGDYSAGGGSVVLAGGAFDLGPGTNIGGGCCVVITGGTVNVLGATVDDGATLKLVGGALGGSGELTVEGTLVWSGGAMTDVGTTRIADDGRMDIVSASAKSLAARTIVNDGVTVWSDGNINAGAGAVIENTGTLSLWTDADLLYSLGGAAPRLHNTGTVRKVVGTLPGATEISVAIDNDGTIDVAAGKLRLVNGTGVSTGTFRASSTTLELAGTFALDGGATFAGDCCVELTGTLDVTNAAVAAGATLRQLGVITGPGTLAVAGKLEWAGGSMSGTGTTQIAATGKLDIVTSAPKALGARTLANAGAVMWTEGTINAGGGGLITNDGAFAIAGEGGLLYTLGGTQPVFRNSPSGTITKSSPATAPITVGLDNDGMVNVQAGTLKVGGAAADPQSGKFTVTGTLEYTGGTHSLTGPTAFAGTGTVRITAGTVTIAGADTAAVTEVAGGTLELNGSGTLGDLRLTAGAIAGSGARTVNKIFTWTGGALGGPGTLTIEPVGRLDITGPTQKVLSGPRKLTNAGTGTWSGGNISTGGGAQVLNSGSLTVTGDNTIAYSIGGAEPSFRNAGTLTKSGAAGATEFVLPFENDGVLKATAGVVRLRNGGPLSTGDFVSSATGSVELLGGTFQLGSGVNFVGCCTRLNGAVVNVANATIATVNLGAVVELSAGSVGGTGLLRVTGTVNWTGGSMVDAGKTEVVASGVLNVAGPNPKNLVARSLTNKGTLNWTGGNINTGGGASITSSKTFVMSGDNTISYNLGGSQPTVTNTGTIRKAAGGGPGTASTIASLAVTSSGTTEVIGGTLAVTGGPFANSGPVILRQAGTLTTSGGISLPAGKTHTVEVAGPTPGAGSGRLDAGGPATLGGTLAIKRAAAFNPPIGATFQIMSFPSRTGTFASVTGALFGSKRFTVQYSATAVTLVVAAA